MAPLLPRFTGAYAIDFTQPPGAPSLADPDSISWQVFKNPVALFVGGITAVLLELAEPRVRSGVWDHTAFRTDPLPRMQRTGMAAMITVYGARMEAETMIARVCAMHDRVQGITPDGMTYRANDPDLLTWVQVTASYGFLEAYHHFVRSLSDPDKDAFYAEALPAAQLYGAVDAPPDLASQQAQFAAMAPRLEASQIVFDFLEIVRDTPILPWPLRWLQSMMIRAGVQITPPWLRDRLGLDAAYGLRTWEARFLRGIGALADRIPVPMAPPAQACRRLGLPASYLYRRRSGA